jgi:hypothetical protein|nr:MAG TPA: hypothetical protein [Caudoviricetes sp.]
MSSINSVKRKLRSYGMREAYTQGNANILYCGYIAIRIINDYTVETWTVGKTVSGTINTYDTIAQCNEAILDMGLIGLQVI